MPYLHKRFRLWKIQFGKKCLLRKSGWCLLLEKAPQLFFLSAPTAIHLNWQKTLWLCGMCLQSWQRATNSERTYLSWLKALRYHSGKDQSFLESVSSLRLWNDGTQGYVPINKPNDSGALPPRDATVITCSNPECPYGEFHPSCMAFAQLWGPKHGAVPAALDCRGSNRKGAFIISKTECTGSIKPGCPTV